MKEYLLILRRAANIAPPDPTPEHMDLWKNWMGGMAQEGKFVAGQPLTPEGKHMKNRSSITDAPFAEGKEVVNGYIIIKAADYNEAVELAKGCPIFDDGGNLEVREIAVLNM